MNLRKLFWPWAEIARLERVMCALETGRNDFRRIANRRLDRLEVLRVERDNLLRELAALKASAQPRDPVTKQWRAKVKG